MSHALGSIPFAYRTNITRAAIQSKTNLGRYLEDRTTMRTSDRDIWVRRPLNIIVSCRLYTAGRCNNLWGLANVLRRRERVRLIT